MSNNKDDATYHPRNNPASAGTHDKGGVYDWQTDPRSGYADPADFDNAGRHISDVRGEMPTKQELHPEKPKKKKRVFLWFFLAVQAIFILWILTGATSAQSNANCTGLDAEACSSATAVGTGIGVFMILVLWVIIDFLLAVGYAIKVVATKNR